MTNSPKAIQAIVFDAYGTLFNVQRLTEKLTSFFPNHAEQLNAIWRKKQLEYTWLRSLMGKYEPFSVVTTQALEFACEAVGVELTTQTKTELVRGYYELQAFDDIRAVLEKLSARFRLAILSNADPEMLEAATARNKLTPYLEAVMSAHKVQTFKPHPSVYTLAEKTLGLDRTAIAFVSSNTWDVSGARAFGLNAIWLRRGQLPMEKLGFEANSFIRDIGALSKLTE